METKSNEKDLEYAIDDILRSVLIGANTIFKDDPLLYEGMQKILLSTTHLAREYVMLQQSFNQLSKAVVELTAVQDAAKEIVAQQFDTVDNGNAVKYARAIFDLRNALRASGAIEG